MKFIKLGYFALFSMFFVNLINLNCQEPDVPEIMFDNFDSQDGNQLSQIDKENQLLADYHASTRSHGRLRDSDERAAVLLGLSEWISQNVSKIEKSELNKLLFYLATVLVDTKQPMLPRKLKLGQVYVDESLKNNQLKIGEILIKNGADVNNPTNNTSILFLALKRNRPDFAKLLLDNGAIINKQVKSLMDINPDVKNFIENYNKQILK